MRINENKKLFIPKVVKNGFKKNKKINIHDQIFGSTVYYIWNICTNYKC